MDIVGYDCQTGECGIIPMENSINPGMYSYLVGVALPCLMCFISYSYIGWFFFTSYKHLKNKQKETEIELKSTWALLFVVLLYVFIIILLYILNFIIQMQIPGVNPNTVRVIGVSIYYLQYSTNFWIYAARSTQYRKAYMHYFKGWKDFLCLDENIEHRVPQPNAPGPKTEAVSLAVQNFAIIFS